MRIVRLDNMTADDWKDVSATELSPAGIAEVYRIGRELFSAADLQKYTEECDEVSAEDVIAELSEMLARLKEAES